MRVYQINVVCGYGSTGKITVDISTAVKQSGGQCRIGYGRGTGSPEADCIRIARKPEVYYHAAMARLAGKDGLCSGRAANRLIKDIKQYGPDIIHLHNIHGYYLNYEMLFGFLKESGLPVVWTMHDCWAFTGHCAHYIGAGCGKWKEGEGCHDCGALSSYPATFCGRSIPRNYRKKQECFQGLPKLTIVTPSNWLKKQVRQSFLQNADCRVIPNGIDLGVFRPKPNGVRKELGCEGKVLLLGVASRWTEKKGLYDFIRLRALLDDGYAICLIGLDKRQRKELPEGIIGIARTRNADELAAYYAAADCFLNLTYEDTFPTTNIEALACGTPVVTYRTGGSAEMLAGGCGIAVKTGSVEEAVAFLEQMKPQSRKEICRKRAEAFDKEICWSSYIDLYRELLGE